MQLKRGENTEKDFVLIETEKRGNGKSARESFDVKIIALGFEFGLKTFLALGPKHQARAEL